MIDLYTWTTPNGRKISILLEEMGLEYAVHPVDISKDEQFTEDFLSISPNNKIPAIVDRENGVSIFESGAILMYLAEKTGEYLPVDPPQRAKVLEWLQWQVGGFGPMLGQLGHFVMYREDKVPAAIERFTEESKRLYTVLDKRLGDVEYVGGAYSIADMAIYPWSKAAIDGVQGLTGTTFGNVEAWHQRLAARPAVQKGMLVPQVD